MGEEQALTFLVNWKSDGNRFNRRTGTENRKMKMAQKKDCRHFDEPESRPERPKERRRLSTAELKKVTKCANCGEKGHWVEDCKRPFKPKQTSGIQAMPLSSWEHREAPAVLWGPSTSWSSQRVAVF